MFTNHFTFQDATHDDMLFTPVVENEVGEGDKAFLTDYPKNILISEDLELVPWMVGLTSSDGAFSAAFFPVFAQAGENNFTSNTSNTFLPSGSEMVTATRRTYHLILFQTTVLKFKMNHYFLYSHPL
jgi:hypothetical protein